MRRSLVLLSLVVAIVGCGARTTSTLQGYVRGTTPSRLDDEDAALLRAMIAEHPTDEAIAARERIDELSGVGSDDVHALLASSIAWLEELHRSGALENVDAHCLPSSSKDGDEPRDVIGDLASGPVEPVDPSSLTIFERLGLDFVWSAETTTPECRRTYAVLRALAMTRVWLATNVDEPGVLEPFRRAVEAIAGAPPPRECTSSDTNDVLVAVTRHLAELDPLEPVDGIARLRQPRLLGRAARQRMARRRSPRRRARVPRDVRPR